MSLRELIDKLEAFYLKHGEVQTIGQWTFVEEPGNPRFSIKVESYRKKGVEENDRD